MKELDAVTEARLVVTTSEDEKQKVGTRLKPLSKKELDIVNNWIRESLAKGIIE